MGIRLAASANIPLQTTTNYTAICKKRQKIHYPCWEKRYSKRFATLQDLRSHSFIDYKRAPGLCYSLSPHMFNKLEDLEEHEFWKHFEGDEWYCEQCGYLCASPRECADHGLEKSDPDEPGEASKTRRKRFMRQLDLMLAIHAKTRLILQDDMDEDEVVINVEADA